MDENLKDILKRILVKIKQKSDETYATKNDLSLKQNILVSGSNIKTINGNSIIGSGDLEICADNDVTKTEVERIINDKILLEIENRNLAIQEAIKKLVNDSPETLDTISELAKALNDDPNFAKNVMTLIEQKYIEAIAYSNTKYSSNNLPPAVLYDREQILNDAQKIQARNNIGAGTGNSNFSGNYNDLINQPTKLSQFSNDTGFITGITKAMVTKALGYTPPSQDTDTTYSAGAGLSQSGTIFSVKYGSVAETACQGNDIRLSNARPASDVYSWAKQPAKPSYNYSEIMVTPKTYLHSIKMFGNIVGIGIYEVFIKITNQEISPFTLSKICDVISGEIGASGILEYGNRYNPIAKVDFHSDGSFTLFAINLSGSKSYLSYTISSTTLEDIVHQV